jgi:hypothetical protein
MNCLNNCMYYLKVVTITKKDTEEYNHICFLENKHLLESELNKPCNFFVRKE